MKTAKTQKRGLSNPPLQDYEDETDRNRHKQKRRHEALNEKAQEAGWQSWSAFATAVKGGEVAIPLPPDSA